MAGIALEIFVGSVHGAKRLETYCGWEFPHPQKDSADQKGNGHDLRPTTFGWPHHRGLGTKRFTNAR